jgi:hypothetical protein
VSIPYIPLFIALSLLSRQGEDNELIDSSTP